MHRLSHSILILTDLIVPSEVRTKYIGIIDTILNGADLTTITRKSILIGIQDRIEYDITPQKVGLRAARLAVVRPLTCMQTAIKALIDQRFDVINARLNGESPVVPSVEAGEPIPKTNGVHKPSPPSPSSSPAKREASSEDMSDVVDSPPPKKKRKNGIDADAAFAAKLQAEEDLRARPTRGGANRKAAPAKKKRKVKKKERVTGSDDSEAEDGEKPAKPKRDTGFHVSN